MMCIVTLSRRALVRCHLQYLFPINMTCISIRFGFSLLGFDMKKFELCVFFSDKKIGATKVVRRELLHGF